MEGRNIIILAMGSSRLQCPYDSEVWTVNMGYQQVSQAHGRIDKIFMAHKQVYSAEGNAYFDWEHYKTMAEAGVEMLNLHTIRGVPFKRFPLRQITRKFNLGYYSDTICYMIAYALHISTRISRKTHKPVLKHPLKLRLYGVDMHQKDEYQNEKGGIEAWIGYALGLGADIEIANGSTLLMNDTGLPYGLEGPDLSYYDPFNLVKTGKKPSPEEMAAIIKTLDKRKPPKHVEKFAGELSEGLHRCSN